MITAPMGADSHAVLLSGGAAEFCSCGSLWLRRTPRAGMRNEYVSVPRSAQRTRSRRAPLGRSAVDTLGTGHSVPAALSADHDSVDYPCAKRQLASVCPGTKP